MIVGGDSLFRAKYMSLFQIIIILASLGFVARALVRCYKKQISLWLFLLWTALWVGVVLIAVYPVIINRLADLVGIGRGVDLIIYLALGVVAYILFKQQVRLGKQEKDLAKMVQTKAVDDAFESVARERASDNKI